MLQYTHLRHERCTYWTLAEKEFTKLTLENIYTRTENLSFIRHSIAHGDLGRSSHLRAASSPGHGGRSRGRRCLLIVGTLARLGKLLAELLLFLLTAHLAELLSGARVRHFLTAWANVRGDGRVCRTAKWLEAEGETGEGCECRMATAARVAPFMAGLGDFSGICNVRAPCNLSVLRHRGKRAHGPGQLVRKSPRRR